MYWYKFRPSFLSAIFFCLAGLQVEAQSRLYSLTFKNHSFVSALDSIEKHSGNTISFTYKNELIQKAHPVTFSVKAVALKPLLELLFEKQPLTYEINGSYISIGPKDLITPSPKTNLPAMPGLDTISVSGRVLAAEGRLPLEGASVKVIGTEMGTATDKDGLFRLQATRGTTLAISYVGFRSKVMVIKSPADALTISLEPEERKLAGINVVSTGYQNIPIERATGSFFILDSALISRRVSANVLDRLDGVVTGLFFNGLTDKRINPLGYDQQNVGINIRGESSLYAGKNPLIVLDNFPFGGDINLINPNDVETITVLKDAAAASIWGANAANGVIVITTKKGRRNQRLALEVNTNVTISKKPDIFKNRNFLSSRSYLDVEKLLFDQGYYDFDIADESSMTPVTPGVDIYAELRAGKISADKAKSIIDDLAAIDFRKTLSSRFYQPAIMQQYALNLKGGSENTTYYLSAGFDNDRQTLVRNSSKRITLNSFNSFRPLKNLEFSSAINYSSSNTAQPNNYSFEDFMALGLGNYKNNYLYPYASLVSANGDGLPVTLNYRDSYVKKAAQNGFLDWGFRPYEELHLADNNTKSSNLLLRLMGKYKIIPQLDIEIQYQHEQQQIFQRNFRDASSYYVRNMVNRFTSFDAATGIAEYVFPKGGILETADYTWRSQNARAQLNYHQNFGSFAVDALGGYELRERKTEGYPRIAYGYNDQFGTDISNLNYNVAYPVNPGGTAFIPSPDNDVNGSLTRYLSQYFNGSVIYDNRYVLNLSGRRDGANIFGVKTNDKITPLWSAGLGWNISNEAFYNTRWLPRLKIRGSYGFNGNVYYGSAYLSGRYLTAPVTGLERIAIETPPNPALRWEKVRNINIGIDFSALNNRISGVIEGYQKNGKDLVQPTFIAPQTGFTTVMANTALTSTKGIDITLNTSNLDGPLKWTTTLLLSIMNDKLVRFDAPQTINSIQKYGEISGLVGRPLYGVFSYRYAGVDAAGDPVGYLNGGKSKDYEAVMNNFNPDSLQYNGSARPTKYGAFRNELRYKNFAISFNITFKLGYVFRRPSTPLNYSELIESRANMDYEQRWQKPGDENNTKVPALVLLQDRNRSRFYTYSEVLVERGDHIRLQDIRLDYQVRFKGTGKVIQYLNLYAYLSNVGLLWQQSKTGIDPDTFGFGMANPVSFSFGINAKF